MPIEDITNNSLNKSLNITPITPVNTFNQNPTSLSLTGSSSSATAVSASSYNSTTGYGLVNAGSAVSKAAGQGAYADVPAIGGNNWGADLTKAPNAWAHGYTGKGVVVAVLDTGVDYSHPDLKNNIWTNTKDSISNGKDSDGNGYVNDIHGWNFVDNNNNVFDNNGHGTHVSGTIAGEKNNYGVTGIAYDAKIMPVKVLDSSGSGSYTNIAKGIRYAVDNGANVINLSLGGYFSNDTLKSAIEYAGSKGVIVVMAAGNNGASSPDYPGRYATNTGIVVGAVDKTNKLADFSNRSGSQTINYVTAPGVDIYSTVPNNKYATYSGTSMASPHVAGVVALMLSANHYLTQSQVQQILTSTAVNSTQSPTPKFPFGLFNLKVSTQSTQTVPLPSIVLAINDNNIELRFGNFENPISKNPSPSSVSTQSNVNLSMSGSYQPLNRDTLSNKISQSRVHYYEGSSGKKIDENQFSNFKLKY